jgi:uncharacterized protein YbbK (DUF523 family)
MTTLLLRLGISGCLLGEEVRFDGGHKLDGYGTAFQVLAVGANLDVTQA